MSKDTTPHREIGAGRRVGRRQAIQLAGVAGAMMVAGCNTGSDGDGGDGGSGDGGDGDGDGQNSIDTLAEEEETAYENEDELDDVDQDFRVRTHRGTDEFNYYVLDHAANFIWDRFMYDHGVWGKWAHVVYQDVGDPQLNYGLYEEVVSEDDRLEITVSDDAYWSNGDPVTGRDAIVSPIQKRLEEASMTFEDVDESGPNYAWEAITDFEYDGREATLYSDGGHFGDILDTNIWRRLLVEYGPRYHSRIDPYEEYADVVFEVMERAVNGEIDPWNANGVTTKTAIQNAVIDDEDHWKEHFRDPDNVHTNGAWTLKEVRGDTEIVLEQNEYHRNADAINFNDVIIESIGANDAVLGALQAERLDLTGAEPKAHIIDEISDTYGRHVVPSITGRSLELNHGYDDVIGDPRVRQALLTAIDPVQITETINSVLLEPMTMPSGDNRGLPAAATDEWIEENLMDYERDREFADDLMTRAGYEKDSDGMWIDEEGNFVEIPIYTNSQNPEEELVIEEQFREFGFTADTVALGFSAFDDSLDRGDLSMWPQSGNAGFAYYAIAGEIAGAGGYRYAHHHKNVMRRHGFFDGSTEEQIEQTEWDEEGWPATRDPDDLEHLTVTAPPIGEFWAEPSEWKEWPVLSMTYRLSNAVGSERDRLWRELLWLNNWHLPALPYANENQLSFVNTDNWHWPTDHEAWGHLGVSDNLSLEHLLCWGDEVFANPDNPKN